MKKGESNIINALALEYHDSLSLAAIRASDLDSLVLEELHLCREVERILFPPEEERDLPHPVIENIDHSAGCIAADTDFCIEEGSGAGLEVCIPNLSTDLYNSPLDMLATGSSDEDDPYADPESVVRYIAGLNIASEGNNWL